MRALRFLIDTPVVAFMLLLVLLVTIVPIVGALLSRNRSRHPDHLSTLMKEPPTTRFLGVQMDIAILILGLLLLLGVIGWIHKTYFG
jgi:amino acid transporter